MSALSNKAVVRRFYQEIINNKNLYVIDELVGDGWTDHNPDPGQPSGRDGLKAHFGGMLQAFPNMRAEILQVIGEGDLVAAEIKFTGTHLAKLGDIEATGRDVEITGFDWLRIDNGQAVERWGVFDKVGFMNQMGLIPGPTPGDLKAFSARYVDLLDQGKGDLTAIRKELFHPHFSALFAGQDAPLDVENFQTLLTGMWAAFPNIKHTVNAQIAEGNLVINRMTVTATHKGQFAGIAATDKNVKFDVVASHRYSEGKIIEAHVQPDIASLLQQIGAIPTPKA